MLKVLGPVHMIPLSGTSRLPMISPRIVVFLLKFYCVHMKERAGPFAEILLEFARIIGRRGENFPM